VRPRAAIARLTIAVVATGAVLVALAGSATAQVQVSPNASPTKNDGGWIYWIAIALAVVGVLVALLIVFGYMRFAPRFQRDEQGRKTVKAPRLQPGEDAPRRPVNITGAPVVVPAPAAAPVPVAAAVAAAPAPAPAPAAAPAPAPVPAAPTPAAESAAAPAPAAAVAPAERKEVALDQETFDRVLAELLEKGTARRVAEGQARRAAMIAARKKAEG
jgi:hypothetical protein